jgi:transcriptional regulator of arginine metabolism
MQKGNKKLRQAAISRLISTSNIPSQDALLIHIREQGFECTQATLSRDLHEMRIVRVPTENRGYVYAMPPDSADIMLRISRKNHLSDGFLGMKFSGNLVVIQTLPGYASSIAMAIDQARIPDMLGTIAGDDTILAVVKENVTKEAIKEVLVKTLPFIRNKI